MVSYGISYGIRYVILCKLNLLYSYIHGICIKSFVSIDIFDYNEIDTHN